MTQESEASATAERQTVKGQGGAGLFPSLLAVLLSGLFCWQWLIPALTTAADDPASAGVSVSELAPVDEQDVAGAIGTLGGSPEFINSIKDRSRACPRPLAWVSIMREPGQPVTKVRLRSGGYISPLFTLSDVPLRVAIPYPAPYDRGTGRLTLVGGGGHAAVALRPVWHADVQGDGVTRNVTWRPVKRCVEPNG